MIKGKYVGNTQGENDLDVKREVPIIKDGPKDGPEDVRITCAQVVTLDVHENPTSELVIIVGVDVYGGTIGVFRGATAEEVKVGVIEDVARGGIEEVTEYAYEDVSGGAPIFSCFIW